MTGFSKTAPVIIVSYHVIAASSYVSPILGRLPIVQQVEYMQTAPLTPYFLQEVDLRSRSIRVDS